MAYSEVSGMQCAYGIQCSSIQYLRHTVCLWCTVPVAYSEVSNIQCLWYALRWHIVPVAWACPLASSVSDSLWPPGLHPSVINLTLKCCIVPGGLLPRWPTCDLGAGFCLSELISSSLPGHRWTVGRKKPNSGFMSQPCLLFPVRSWAVHFMVGRVDGAP